MTDPVTGDTGIPGAAVGMEVRCVGVGQEFEVDGERVVALAEVSMTVPAGQSVALFGPSGSGKSTLTSLLAGLRRPTSGQVWLGADELSGMSERKLLRLRGRHVGVVVQNPARSLLPYATAEDNIRFARRAAAHDRRQRCTPPRELLRSLGLGRLADERAGDLSGGEQQRLSIGVAMAGGPGLLLADEPTSQLDSANRDRVVDLLAHVAGEFGSTVVVVTHDPVVADATDRRITLADGRIVDDSRPTSTSTGTGTGTGDLVGAGDAVRRRRHRAQHPDADVLDVGAHPSATADAVATHTPPSARPSRPAEPGAVVAESISYARGGRAILDQVSITAHPGEALAVTGPSGSGKSTLVAVLAGLERADSGIVRRGTGTTPTGRDGLILQGYGLVGTLTAAENVETPLQADALGRRSRREIRERSAVVLDGLGLTPVADHLIEELSGGQQQRVAIARALAVDPAAIFADEFTAELDRNWKDHVVETVLDIARRGGVVVLATHDPDIANRCAQVVHLRDGRVDTASTDRLID